MPLKKPRWRRCQLTNFGASNEETKSKIGIYVKKNEQYRSFQRFWLLVSIKSKSTAKSKWTVSMIQDGSKFFGSSYEPGYRGVGIIWWCVADMD